MQTLILTAATVLSVASGGGGSSSDTTPTSTAQTFDSATSQFFINVVEAIKGVSTRTLAGLTNVPTTDVLILSATQTQ